MCVQFESWAFTAGIFIDFWKKPFFVNDTAVDVATLQAAGVTESWGYRFAEKVVEGAIRSFLYPQK